MHIDTGCGESTVQSGAHSDHPVIFDITQARVGEVSDFRTELELSLLSTELLDLVLLLILRRLSGHDGFEVLDGMGVAQNKKKIDSRGCSRPHDDKGVNYKT